MFWSDNFHLGTNYPTFETFSTSSDRLYIKYKNCLIQLKMTGFLGVQILAIYFISKAAPNKSYTNAY